MKELFSSYCSYKIFCYAEKNLFMEIVQMFIYLFYYC